MLVPSSCTFLLKNTSKENTHGIPTTTTHSSQREILKIVLNSKPLFLFERNEIKIASRRQWNGIHVGQVMPVFQRTAANVFPTLISVAALVHAILMRSIFISRHLTIHLRPHAWRPKYCIANGIFTVAAANVTVKYELPISIHNRWPEWLTLLTNGH